MADIYWNKKFETATRDELRKHQLQLLKEKVKFCYENTAFYRNRLKSAGISPSDIKTLEDAQKIPFTVKDDLRDNYPFGMVAVHLDNIVEIHASSGTTGNPIVGAYTTNDMDVWAELMARSLYATGVRRQDVIHNAYGYGLFTGGLGFHYGAQKIGSTIIPVSGGMTQRQIKLMKDLGSTVLCCTPSYAIYLAEAMNKEGVDPRRDLKLKIGHFGAEPWSERIRERIEKELGIEAFDIYGLTELCGPGVSVECNKHNGLHIWEDHFLVETIDPKTGDVLSAGEEGELVFTPLTKTGLPLLRFRTRDISVIETEKCDCGRTHSRMMRIRGRSDDMLIIRGVNVFPSQIEYVIMGFPELAAQYQIILDRPEALDVFTIKAELTEQTSKSTQEELNVLKRRIKQKVSNITGLSPIIELVKPGEIPRTVGKAKRVLDLRSGKI
ncbi:MAG: phenylacetate--CoA ligase [Candidatus Bathyarchaeota archaeon]|nr:phenylacetate--CoA ligase [Candidatus Bathyarchaeota archaeon]